MCNKGDIVYHKQVIFGNKVLDQKEKRPCVVLFEVEHNGTYANPENIYGMNIKELS